MSACTHEGADPFGTAALRETVLTSWAAAPARFREDANAEEDLALGGYRDRLVVELAQNAADAASRAGVPGRLLLALREDPPTGRAVLLVANTGAPLDAEGVQALCTLRASAKRDEGTVGRFGVGFSAVLAVTDTPSVLSRTGGVGFCAAHTTALVRERSATSPGLGEELSRRDGHVPVLRLPFPAAQVPPEGYDTAVVLPLRDAAAGDEVLRQLRDVADPLLLALPALDEVTVEVTGEAPRTVRDAASRWHTVRRQGRHDPHLLADRPTEERLRPSWQLTWAVPRDPGLTPPRVLHAPTPTDEPLAWPALLLATFPLESARRHVAPGPARQALVARAAHAYADLLAERAAAGQDVLALVPVGLPAGPLDGELREAVRPLLPAVPLLHSAEDHSTLVRPCDAVALEGPPGADTRAVAALAVHVAGLVHAPRSASAALAALDVRRLALADVVDAFPAVHEPERLTALYDALDALSADPLQREALAGLPVALADGRVVRGARGVLMPVVEAVSPGRGADALGGAATLRGADALGGAATLRGADALGGADALAPAVARALVTLRVRAVDPRAAHPVLERLGAVPAGPRAVLESADVRAAVLAGADPEDLPFPGDDALLPDAEAVALAVLDLVEAALAVGEGVPGWLGELSLPDDEDDLAPASCLALPGTLAAEIFDPEDVGLVDAGLVERRGPEVLRAVGVRESFALLRAQDVPLGPDTSRTSGGFGPQDPDEAWRSGWRELDGFGEWAETVLALPQVTRVTDDLPAGLPVEAVLVELTALRDLDAVRPAAWPLALRALARDPEARAAVLDPALLLVGGRRVEVPPYSAWWLRRRVAGGAALAGPDADVVLRALLPAAPADVAGLDRRWRAALGVLERLEDVDALAVPVLLDRLADPGLELDAAALLDVWHRIALCARLEPDVDPPAMLRVVDGFGTRLVPAQDAVVVDDPAALQRGDLGGLIPVPPALAAGLADLLDVELASEVLGGDVDETAEPGEWSAVPREVLRVLPSAPARWCEHESLVVDGVEVDWWVDGHGDVHAATLEGLARGLARSAGAWRSWHAVAEVLAEPRALAAVLMDEVFGA